MTSAPHPLMTTFRHLLFPPITMHIILYFFKCSGITRHRQQSFATSFFPINAPVRSIKETPTLPHAISTKNKSVSQRHENLYCYNSFSSQEGSTEHVFIHTALQPLWEPKSVCKPQKAYTYLKVTLPVLHTASNQFYCTGIHPCFHDWSVINQS